MTKLRQNPHPSPLSSLYPSSTPSHRPCPCPCPSPPPPVKTPVSTHTKKPKKENSKMWRCAESNRDCIGHNDTCCHYTTSVDVRKVAGGFGGGGLSSPPEVLRGSAYYNIYRFVGILGGSVNDGLAWHMPELSYICIGLEGHHLLL